MFFAFVTILLLIGYSFFLAQQANGNPAIIAIGVSGAVLMAAAMWQALHAAALWRSLSARKSSPAAH